MKKQATKKDSTIKKEVVKVIKTELPKKKVVMSSSLTALHALRHRLEGAEATLSQHVHIGLGDDGVHDCGLRITQLEVNADAPKPQPEVTRVFWRRPRPEVGLGSS